MYFFHPFPSFLFCLSSFSSFVSFFPSFFTRLPFFLPFYISFSLFSSLFIPPSVIPPIPLKYRKRSSGAVFHIYDFSVHQSIADFGEPPSEHSSVEMLPVWAEKGRLRAEQPREDSRHTSPCSPAAHSTCFLFLHFFFFPLLLFFTHMYIFALKATDLLFMLREYYEYSEWK